MQNAAGGRAHLEPDLLAHPVAKLVLEQLLVVLLCEVVFLIARQPHVEKLLRGPVQIDHELVGRVLDLLFFVLICVALLRILLCVTLTALLFLVLLRRNCREGLRPAFLGIRVLVGQRARGTLEVRPALNDPRQRRIAC